MESLTHVLRSCIADYYKLVVPMVSVGLCWTAILIPGVFWLPIPAAMAYLSIMSGVLIMASVSFIQQKRLDDKVKFSVFMKGCIRFGVPGMAYGALMLLFIGIVVSAWWYWSVNGAYWAFVVACFQTYFVAMLWIGQMFAVPLYVKYGHSLGNSMLVSLKLLVKHPLYTLGGFVQLASLAVVLLVTVVGFPLLFPGIFGLWLNRMTANVISHYDPSEGLTHEASS